MEVPIDLSDAVFTGIGVAGIGYGLVEFVRRMRKNASRQTSLSTDAWHGYALEHNWPFHGGPAKASFRGAIDGQPLSAEVNIRRTRGRHGREYVTARSTFRVPIRGRAPVLSIRKKSLQNRFMLLLGGGRPFATDFHKIDESLLVSGEDVDEVVALIRKSPVRLALEMLARVCPEAVVHERAVELTVDGMMSESRELDRTLEAMTAVAAAIEMSIPRIDGSPPVFPERSPSDEASSTATEPSRPVPPDVRRRPEALYMAMRRLARQSSQQQALTIQHLRIPPYTFDIEVRSITQAETSIGITTGDLQVNGVLTRGNWRVELVVPADQANMVLTLITGDVIRGECLLDNVRPGRQTAEAKATAAIELVSRGTPHEDAVR